MVGRLEDTTDSLNDAYIVGIDDEGLKVGKYFGSEKAHFLGNLVCG